MTRSATGHATFHSLEFAAQLVVWAMRKRLHLLRNGHDDSDVARAFALGRLDAVHAAAFPYSYPIVCGLRLARRRGVPFLLTPFLHLGDPADPRDRTRRQYTAPHLRWLLRQAYSPITWAPS